MTLDALRIAQESGKVARIRRDGIDHAKAWSLFRAAAGDERVELGR